MANPTITANTPRNPRVATHGELVVTRPSSPPTPIATRITPNPIRMKDDRLDPEVNSAANGTCPRTWRSSDRSSTLEPLHTNTSPAALIATGQTRFEAPGSPEASTPTMTAMTKVPTTMASLISAGSEVMRLAIDLSSPWRVMSNQAAM